MEKGAIFSKVTDGEGADHISLSVDKKFKPQED